MFTVFIVQPIFNLLVLIYALIPGHNFGLAIILFTIFVRVLMWPLVKKQLHHTKAIRELQPEVKKIKAAAKGDRQKESRLLMELYKERQINPLSTIGILLVQLPILLGLYIGLKKIIDHPEQLIDFSYSFVHDLSWMKHLAGNIQEFDHTLFGAVDLTRKAVENNGIYWPAMFIVVASAVAQFFQSKQLLPVDKDARSLRKIITEAGSGKTADQAEVNAAVGRSTVFLIPLFVLLVSLHLASALPLYWLVTAIVAYVQQSMILKEDTEELEQSSNSDATIEKSATKEDSIEKTSSTRKTKKKSSKKNKRRKK